MPVAMNRVTVGRVYQFRPNLFDELMSEHYTAVPGQIVRVVNMPGCPPANTMGQCHIEDVETKEFLGMCTVNSLEEMKTLHDLAIGATFRWVRDGDRVRGFVMRKVLALHTRELGYVYLATPHDSKQLKENFFTGHKTHPVVEV